jgi:hypothetical protein
MLGQRTDEANQISGRWSPEDATKLTDAVGNNRRTTRDGSVGFIAWDTVVAMFPGRTKQQCRNKWSLLLSQRTDEENQISGRWSPEDVTKLTNAVGNKRKRDGSVGFIAWDTVVAMFPGRTKQQCRNKWNLWLSQGD